MNFYSGTFHSWLNITYIRIYILINLYINLLNYTPHRKFSKIFCYTHFIMFLQLLTNLLSIHFLFSLTTISIVLQPFNRTYLVLIYVPAHLYAKIRRNLIVNVNTVRAYDVTISYVNFTSNRTISNGSVIHICCSNGMNQKRVKLQRNQCK